MIYLVLVKFRGEWSLDLVEYDRETAKRYARELSKTNQRAEAIGCDSNDPDRHQEIVNAYNDHF